MTAELFRNHIRLSIADTTLQAALDANAERRGRGRAAAFASLPDWRERRQRAHAVRAQVISHLDEFLAAFSAKVVENGMTVHRAKDAAQAVQLVLQIAQASPHLALKRSEESQGAANKLFAKSKSMVSEEIELNRALEARGHRVVETDLGEYIVQLRGEKPAHIITPAVHLQRRQVGELFQSKLGVPYTDDIPTLTAAARKVLREVFLTADVGISGVNFGVAETGTICIVTNEGNGRMVTTVPPLHIALMGMERIVPTLDDLALMLSLLPRSATGQKLSVYTQLIHSPRRPAETDGASERHLIIVDNGRSRLRDSRLQEALYCIRCGACLNACPVFREIGGHAYVGSDGSLAPYPGPIGSVVSPGLLGLPNFGQLAQASSLCGACQDACPVGIDLPRLLTRVRAGDPDRAPQQEGTALSFVSRIGLQAYGAIASSTRLFAAAQRLGGIGARAVSPFAKWMWLPAVTGWGYSKDFPRPALKAFRARPRDGDASVGPHPDMHDDAIKPWTRIVNPHAGTASTALERAAAAPESVIAASPVDRFVHELELLGGHAYRTESADLTQRVLGLLHERRIDATLAWDDVPEINKAQFKAGGVKLVHAADPALRAGLTGAALAIAETGTLVLTSGKGRPLSTSLLPEIHVVILRASQIVWSLEEALQTKEVREASAVVLVSGPSRTADIEMTLTIGVHGPRELVAYIVE